MGRPDLDDELDVDAVRERAGGADLRRVEQAAGLGEVGHEGDRVRVAHVDGDRRPRTGTVVRDRDCDRGTGRVTEAGRAHVDGDVAGRRDVHLLQAGPRTDREPPGLLGTGVDQVAGEDAGAVAAHLGERAVGVAVVHEPGGRVRLAGRLGDVSGTITADHPEQPVGTQAAAPVADRRDDRRREVELAVRIQDQDEVVARAVPLAERPAGVGHPSSVRAAASTLAARA